jgi:hypothetical protein
MHLRVQIFARKVPEKSAFSSVGRPPKKGIFIDISFQMLLAVAEVF